MGLASAFFWLFFPIFLREVCGYPALAYDKHLTWLYRGMMIGLPALIGSMTNLIERYKSALDEVEKLRGIIPICAKCKKIRDDDGYWQEVEIYLREHSFSRISHGLCLDCAKELYPEEALELEKNYYTPLRLDKQAEEDESKA